MNKTLERSEVIPEYTWNAPSVFATAEAWEAEQRAVAASLPTIQSYQGRLAEGPAVLADAFETLDGLLRRMGKVLVYASMAYYVDTTDQAAGRMYGKARALFGQVLATISFLDPEILNIGHGTLRQWIDEEPRLAPYDHYVDNLFRQQAHIRSAEVEEVLGMLADPFSGPSNIAGLLRDSDLTFVPATASDGQSVPVTSSTFSEILSNPDRSIRRTAWESYCDSYLAFKNTLASTLVTAIKQRVFLMQVRRHTSTLEAALFEHNIPVVVFHNLIDTFRKNISLWHRYWAIRRRALGVETLHPYDIWAPLTPQQTPVSYEQAVQWVAQGLAPLGQDYVDVIRRGCLQDRWVDVFPSNGKTAGAFSSGSPGTHPFILMNHSNDVIGLGTLAHELGHSMHSYLSWQNQPYVYSRYSAFVAEVASNFHQAMLRAHLLQANPDHTFQINMIEEAMTNFHRYFLVMPTLARFELQIHQQVEAGQAPTADDMIDLLADLFAEAYGDEMHVDRQRVGIQWATFPHLYASYYVFQYATGISGAHALANRVRSEGEPAVQDYLAFLKAGSSRYPLDVLQMAGVDLTTPQPVEETFAVLAGLLDRLEMLVGGK